MNNWINKLKVPSLPFYIARKILSYIVIAGVLFGGGYYFGITGYIVEINKLPQVTISRINPPDKQDVDFSLFWKVWDTLSASYYDKTKIIPSNMVYGAIKGMAAAIGDPYTIFLPPQENKVVEADLQGSFSGVGIQIGFKGTQLAVIAPLTDSPAQKAGIRAGDLIIGIEDKTKDISMSTSGISLPDAVSLIRGPEGSKVTLAVIRSGVDNPFDVEITRANIDVPSVVVAYEKDGTIAHIKLLKFSEETLTEWNSVVADVISRPEVVGIVLDLRNDPGGFLQRAIDIGSDFIGQGKVVVLEERANSQKEEFKTNRLPRFQNMRTVVLINGGSASAAEILAGALRDDLGVQLVGETSFGKGTIQEAQDVDGAAGLHITIARWLTPSGYWVNEKGLKPDIEVSDNPDTPKDEQLEAALKVISP